MIKKIFILSLFLTLTNCGAPGTALLGPALTGATTKSAARTTLSFGSNKIIKDIGNFKNKRKHKNLFNFHN